MAGAGIKVVAGSGAGLRNDAAPCKGTNAVPDFFKEIETVVITLSGKARIMG